MAKHPSTIFVCQECGSQSPKWLGRCSDCGAWNSFVEERAQEATAQALATSAHRYALAGAATAARLYSDIEIERMARLSTGIGEFDRVLGSAKGQHTPRFRVGPVTNAATPAGPKALEHAVGTVRSFEGERHRSHRVIRAVKNRFGAVSELGVFEMPSTGLEAVANPSKMFL